ncbi:AraC-like DNA-binding protein [Pedobacter cryoconitis]|uniref:AraC-like DNA-binding protein n=1 Tax=Pedobacter cryoconitis TaxID=188932 RepID=A0A7W9E0Q7_9SPHI|nr:AraC family transcriptional regulator [Pedobacter cryoconitis]MBB5638722.1 AraC-like DNA-binding protein [Pedobacter cryoconitis]
MGMALCDAQGKWTEIGGLPVYADQLLPLVTERREKYSFPSFDAEIVQMALPNIFIVFGDMRLKSQRLRFRSTDEPDFVELHFSLAGGGLMENHINGHIHQFKAMQHNLIYSPEFDGTGNYKPNEPYQFFEIHFRIAYFLELVKDTGNVLSAFCENIQKNHFSDLSDCNLKMTFAMQQCIREIMSCNFSGGLKMIFLQAKCMELLSLQAQSFEQHAKKSVKSVLKTAYETDCIHHAREYLNKNMHTPPSLSELAKIAGINEFKLKNGFKELFDTTVFGYLSDIKLIEAKEQLLSGIPIKVISENLSYSSVQHFSTAFSKKFGISPGKVKMN